MTDESTDEWVELLAVTDAYWPTDRYDEWRNPDSSWTQTGKFRPMNKLPHGRQRHWNMGGRMSSAEDARIEAP